MTDVHKIIEYIAAHPEREPGFKSASKFGVDQQDISPTLYKIVSDLISHAGKMSDVKGFVAGVKEEMEHTSYPEIAALIASKHISEDPEYYG